MKVQNVEIDSWSRPTRSSTKKTGTERVADDMLNCFRLHPKIVTRKSAALRLILLVFIVHGVIQVHKKEEE